MIQTVAFEHKARPLWLTFLMLAIFIPDSRAQWLAQKSPTDARLRGLSVVDPSVAWSSGAKGIVIRTDDAGITWQAKPVLGASELDFRDIQAFDARRAIVLSIGEGEKSRIYKTQDAGATWTLQYKNPDPKAFLDAIAFWDESHGLAFGDPAQGRFIILRTDDAGATWSPIEPTGMPPALEHESAFAASGTCLVVQGTANAWFATGGARVARVFRSVDRGQTWSAYETPVTAGTPSTGIFSLAFQDAQHGVTVGGDYRNPDRADRTSAYTTDGGITWTPSKSPIGYRSAVTFLTQGTKPHAIAVGPTSASRSEDRGRTWQPLGVRGFHAVAAANEAVWAVGEGGVIAKWLP